MKRLALILMFVCSSFLVFTLPLQAATYYFPEDQNPPASPASPSSACRRGRWVC